MTPSFRKLSAPLQGNVALPQRYQVASGWAIPSCPVQRRSLEHRIHESGDSEQARAKSGGVSQEIQRTDLE